ncbi:MAG: hypothetical protein AB1665_06190 [Candidatus Thermoplasmatota archaeon]
MRIKVLRMGCTAPNKLFDEKREPNDLSFCMIAPTVPKEPKPKRRRAVSPPSYP